MYATLDKILHLNNELSSITSNLSYLGLLSLILFHIEKFRLDNNIVQLSDTNSILRQIINKEDTPFIYEKIGTAIHHYLIDEFQDTSQMQWENMLPLLQESLGHNHENLVIGDAKQSIYRFRNADFSIITTNVQESFRKDQLGIHGTTPAENANWRSSKDIVAFNNHFFRAMINDDIIHLDSSGDKPVEDIKALYLNCEQMAKEVSRQGYVEIAQRPEKDTTDDSGDGSAEENKDEDSKKLAPMTEVAPIVCELLSRGYQQKEIAVLVRTNKQGVAVIDGLMKYNSERGKDDPMIDFVSGESLYINRAKSVGIIIAVLEAALQRNIAKIFERAETDPDADHQATQELRAKINSDAEAFVNAIHRYRGEHTEASIVDAMQQYFDGNIEQLTVDDLLKDMDNMLLQAQVESIIGSNFISPTLRKVEAPYIAAFQDKVCDYCENYGSDTAAFLSWWHDNGDKFTIATPEGSDAVNIMTIHKSKGLEFRCVIIPYTDFDYGKINESVWVSPSDLKEKYPTQYPDSVLIKYADELPPWIPMKVSSSMVGTPLESEYISRANRVTIDALNALYVGFTRAVDELYIFYTPKDGKTVTTTTAAIQRYIADYESSFVAAERAGMTRMQKVGSKTTEVPLMSYAKGQKPTSEEVARNRKEKNEEAGRVEMIDSYYVCGSLPSELQFRDVDGVDYVDDFSDEDNNQRERGNILHSVMQYITTQSTMERDIDFALLRAHVRGFISKNVMNEMRKFLLEKLSAEKPREWFRDGLQVINERNLLAYDRFGGKNRRPDRIIVTPHGDATIIDFKFGKASDAELRKYRKQVKEYMSMLEATKMYRSVTGWIWFVALDLYEPVV
jgi:ATP-dependent exoDNAse (exonuclease V) beta subunit